MKKVAFHNLGCKVNSYELDGISQMFQKRGYEIVEFAQKADVYIVNTCTVTNIADHKSRQMLSRARSKNPEAVVVATGCYVQTDPDKMAALGVDIAVGNDHKSRIIDIVEEYIRDGQHTGGCSLTVTDSASFNLYEELPISKTSGHTRAYIKIQDGCDQFCSYCAIPLARGRVRSRGLDDIKEEAARLAAGGYKEVVITGIHISSYGLDEPYNTFSKSGKTNVKLLEAIRTIAETGGIERVRLSSLEPRLLTDDFVGELAKIRGLCPHFHVSLQSGSNSVLERMRRHYTTEEYEEKAALLRKSFTHPAITTDIITGFPGETVDEFNETRAFLQKVNLYECHVFKFSRRRGTAADAMDGQLTDAVKSERSAALIADSQARKRDFMRYYVGKKVEVLVEDTEEFEQKRYSAGYTPEYVRCLLPETESGKISEILCFEAGCDKIMGGHDGRGNR